MKVNYFISAKAQETVQGVVVNLSSEYQKNENPAIIVAVCSGYYETDGIAGKRMMTATYKYNVANKTFDSMSGSNIKPNFDSLILPVIENFNNQIKTDDINN